MGENAASGRGFVVIDRQGLVLGASTDVEAMAGRASRELVGERFVDLFDPAHHQGISARIASVDSEESRRWSTAMLACSDRRTIPVWLRLRRVRAQDGPAGERSCAELRVAPPCVGLCGLGELRAAESVSQRVLQAQESERKRIAADLHDSLGQLLGAAKFGVETAMCAIGRDATLEARATLGDVASVVKQALDEVRRIAMNLRPSTLDDLGILATLSWFLREFRSIYQSIEVESRFAAEESDVPEALKLAIFRVVQEAMCNIAKHSRASRARIRLVRRGEQLTLEIEDNGIGFDMAEVAARRGIAARFGHSCARERVESSGGTFTLSAAPGAGVKIAIAWPIAAADTG